MLDHHKEMAGYLRWVKKALSSPQAIYDSAGKKDHLIQHIHYILPPGKNLYVRVIIHVHEGNKGDFITAHLIAGPKLGERLIWSR